MSDAAPGDLGLGPCWLEDCAAAGVELVPGVPCHPTRAQAELAWAAERVTRLGIVVCADHAPFAHDLAGDR